ncbi:MAG: hypothetical protein FH753_00525 [Firmicutes bacterium]|nr:hypothetical protein [Bacillota bacterium]
MYKKIILIVISIFLLNLTGCISSLDKEDKRLTEKINELEKTNKELQEKINNLETEKSEINEKLNFKEKESYTNNQNIEMLVKRAVEQKNIISSLNIEYYKNNIYPIYNVDNVSLERIIDFYILMPKDLSLKGKIDVISNKLSKERFSLPINLIKIEDKEGKKIAYINLMESKENQNVKDYKEFKGVTWKTLYFQGSLGASKTSTTLKESFLQREYKGEWIDGVKFLYNNEEINFEHVFDLKEIIYR